MRIALVHLCAFGDCLYATLLARQIRRDHPDCQLTWVIGDRYASVLDGNPDVNFVHSIPVTGVSDALSSAWQTASAWVEDQITQGRLDKAVYSQILPDNMLHYDGLIRSTVYRSYGRPVTGPHQPVLVSSVEEERRVHQFLAGLQTESFRHVFLFECGPRSGQSPMTPDRAEKLARQLTERHPDLLLLLSSDRPLVSPGRQVADASQLTIRENAVLARFCTGLIGCSSGITWISTSTAGKPLPMLQILTKSTDAFRFASVAADFERFEQNTDLVIELAEPLDTEILACIQKWIAESHSAARSAFHQKLRFTAAHAVGTYRFIRNHHSRKDSLRSLQTLLHRNQLRFPWQIVRHELAATWRDTAQAVRGLLRTALRRTGLLGSIRRLLNRNPDTGERRIRSDS